MTIASNHSWLGGGRWNVLLRPALVVLIVVAVLAVGGLASADGGEPFSGPFTAVAVRPPQCTSPVGLCTHGTLYDQTGRVVAFYDFTMDSLQPDGNGSEFSFTGHSVITKAVAPNGVMFGHDHGVLTPNGLRPWPFTTIVEIIEGTESYERAHGTITATGGLDPTTGGTQGTYSGAIERSP